MGFISENCMGNMWCNDARIGKDMWLQRRKGKINNDLFSSIDGCAVVMARKRAVVSPMGEVAV
jgi:hypothetical protein